ncbi:hypothetical protein FOL47_000299 [Perkinsus chesapeaki]|uniref:Uncharacterized protein n=1 Tax=Perkinsus chesapeaki TaxID=330153 RepID=A0A7J6MNQ6_PERCH|nr:hypothetical protein FOL47_000299 [Perkinsus chesapeaki]
MFFFSTTLYLVVLISHAEYPDGVFKGEVSDPYLFIDITFHEDVPTSWVFIEVKCSRNTTHPPNSIFDIEDSGGSPKKFEITGDTDDYDKMIFDLNVLCNRNYQSGDFAQFTEVTPNKTYNVKVKDSQVAVTKTTQM